VLLVVVHEWLLVDCIAAPSRPVRSDRIRTHNACIINEGMPLFRSDLTGVYHKNTGPEGEATQRNMHTTDLPVSRGPTCCSTPTTR